MSRPIFLRSSIIWCCDITKLTY